MNAIRNLNLDVLKRPKILITLLVVVVAVVVWYIFVWSHEGAKLASVKNQQATESAKIVTLKQQLAAVDIESQQARKYAKYLTFFSAAVPVAPEQGQLVQMLGDLAKSDDVDISTLSVTGTAPPVAPSTLSTIPVSMSFTGTHSDVIKFVEDLYNTATMPRLLTIGTIAPSPSTSSSSKGPIDVLKLPDSTQYSVTLSATAYFSGQEASTAG